MCSCATKFEVEEDGVDVIGCDCCCDCFCCCLDNNSKLLPESFDAFVLILLLFIISIPLDKFNSNSCLLPLNIANFLLQNSNSNSPSVRIF